MKAKRYIGVFLSVVTTCFIVLSDANTLNVSATESTATTIDEAYPEIEQIEPSETSDTSSHSCSIDSFDLSLQTQGFSLFSETAEANEPDNTDPNGAYVVSNENVFQGNLGQTNEMRWYAFILDQDSKVTIELQCVSDLDADLYLFALDQESYQLSLIGGSATEGNGIHEQYKGILNSGIYYFAVSAYAGSGQYAFAFYSTDDTQNEINDAVDNASSISLNETISGKIDSPYDIDYYVFSVDSSAIISIPMDTLDYEANIASLDSNSHAYHISNVDPIYEFTPGTYCIYIFSSTGKYSSSDTYTITTNKIANVADNSKAFYFMVNDAANIVFQSDGEGGNMYVNGHPIDVTYSYNFNFSTSGGIQNYDIKMINRDDIRAKIFQSQFSFPDNPELAIEMGMDMPDAIEFLSSTRGSGVTGNLLDLSIYTKDYDTFYQIHCIGTGAYAKNNYWADYFYATVFIDPNTGKLVDIYHDNYFYDHALGSNSMSFIRPYGTHTKYYYPYYNGKEPFTW